MFPFLKKSVNSLDLPATGGAANAIAVPQAPRAEMSQSIDAKAENIKSVLSKDEVVEGNLRFRFGAKVDGKVVGNVHFGSDDGLLVLNRDGMVIGDIIGPRAIILGEVRGNIKVTGKLIIMASARVYGDIISNSITINDGAKIDGRVCSILDYENGVMDAAAKHEQHESQIPQQQSLAQQTQHQEPPAAKPHYQIPAHAQFQVPAHHEQRNAASILSFNHQPSVANG